MSESNIATILPGYKRPQTAMRFNIPRLVFAIGALVFIVYFVIGWLTGSGGSDTTLRPSAQLKCDELYDRRFSSWKSQLEHVVRNRYNNKITLQMAAYEQEVRQGNQAHGIDAELAIRSMRRVQEIGQYQLRSVLCAVGKCNGVMIPFQASTQHCTMDTCFDISRCYGKANDATGQKVYIYPRPGDDNSGDAPNEPYLEREEAYFDENIEALRRSPMVTGDPNEACLFVPYITQKHPRWDTLPYWNGGRNHVFFLWHPAPQTKLQKKGEIGDAIIAKTSFAISPPIHFLYRMRFDVNLGLDHMVNYFDEDVKPINERKYLLTFMGKRYTEREGRLRGKLRRITNADSGDDIRICMTCRHQDQPRDEQCDKDEKFYYDKSYCDFKELIIDSKFVLAPEGRQFASYRLAEAMSAGSIPVFVGNAFHLPYSEIIDWSSCSFYFRERDLEEIGKTLRMVHPALLAEMSDNAREVFRRYWLGGVPRLFESAFEVIFDRVQQKLVTDHKKRVKEAKKKGG
eukprot:Clim_evm10s13 gene=Clim_evmTU10s13